MTQAKAPADLEGTVRSEFARRADEWKVCIPVDQVAWLHSKGRPRLSVVGADDFQVCSCQRWGNRRLYEGPNMGGRRAFASMRQAIEEVDEP